MVEITITEAEVFDLIPPFLPFSQEMAEFIIERLPSALISHLEDEVERLAMDYLDRRYQRLKYPYPTAPSEKPLSFGQPHLPTDPHHTGSVVRR